MVDHKFLKIKQFHCSEPKLVADLFCLIVISTAGAVHCYHKQRHRAERLPCNAFLTVTTTLKSRWVLNTHPHNDALFHDLSLRVFLKNVLKWISFFEVCYPPNLQDDDMALSKIPFCPSLLWNYQVSTFPLNFLVFFPNERSGVRNSVKTPLVFVRKGIRNLKCYVAPAKSWIQKRVCSDRHTLNQHI